MGENVFCSRVNLVGSVEWSELIGVDDMYQIELPRNDCQLIVEIWNYDAQSKLGEVRFDKNDLPFTEK
jgi:hypothetical protein